MLLLARLGGRKFRGGAGTPVRVVHRQALTRGSALTVVEVGGRVLVLGTTEQQVNVLAELDPSEVEGATVPAATPDDTAHTTDGVDGAEGDEPALEDEVVEEEVEPDLLSPEELRVLAELAALDEDAATEEPADQEVLELPAGLPSLVPAHLAGLAGLAGSAALAADAAAVAAAPAAAPLVVVPAPAPAPVASEPVRGRRCAAVPVDSAPVLTSVGHRLGAPAAAHAGGGRRIATRVTAPVPHPDTATTPQDAPVPAAPPATPAVAATPAPPPYAVSAPVRAAVARPAVSLDDFLASVGIDPATATMPQTLAATPAATPTAQPAATPAPAPAAAPAAEPARAPRRTRAPREVAAQPSGPLAGSVLSPQTWRQAIAAVRRAS
nr:flagellar biosynthetic protein FliO [Nocardioides perillae]